MSVDLQYLDLAEKAIKEVESFAQALNKSIEKGDEQVTTSEGAIQTINDMCDALQSALDHISKELSTSIIEFNGIKYAKEDMLRSYFGTVAIRFSKPPLHLLLHEGKVCGELHKLGDRFEQPTSIQTTSGISSSENLKRFFSQSNTMRSVLHGLIEGERIT